MSNNSNFDSNIYFGVDTQLTEIAHSSEPPAPINVDEYTIERTAEGKVPQPIHGNQNNEGVQVLYVQPTP